MVNIAQHSVTRPVPEIESETALTASDGLRTA